MILEIKRKVVEYDEDSDLPATKLIFYANYDDTNTRVKLGSLDELDPAVAKVVIERIRKGHKSKDTVKILEYE